MRKLILLVVLVGVCSGCAGQPTKWCKQGATAEGFNRDKFECKRAATQMAQHADVEFTWEIPRHFNDCMESRGYLRNTCP